jgi:hypothetical protein
MKHFVVGAALLVMSFSSHTFSEEKKLDDGLLDPAWFGPAVEFRKTDVADYLWVKPGFTVKGKTVHVQTWTDPVLLDKKRDAKDSAMASKLTEEMPGLIRGSLSSSLADVSKVSRETGDLAMTGRFVDCNATWRPARSSSRSIIVPSAARTCPRRRTRSSNGWGSLVPPWPTTSPFTPRGSRRRSRTCARPGSECIAFQL